MRSNGTKNPVKRSRVADVTKSKEDSMKIGVTSMYVDDQEKALRFYTDRSRPE
jgi:hypothetical protein